jgi:2,4-dienoyl-CoA reductase-like NADH-dependent reductase (Old Yellow Enzyme family)/thioredoxin reductase
MADIFDPIKIGNVRIKNRVMMAATMSNFANIDGSVSDQLVAYLKNIAAGEVGVIVTGHAFIDDIASKGYRCMLGCHRSGLGLERLAKAVKEYDCACFVQLNHIGPKADPAFTKGLPVGPMNTVSHFRKKPVDVRMLTVEEIKEIVKTYGAAAARVEEAGFDGVEIHSAHNYLLSSFISPAYNKRIDEYGGDLEGRVRFTLEVLESVKQSVSDDFIVGVRWNGIEFIPGGLPFEEGVKVGQIFEKAGVDYLNVSQTSTVRKAAALTTFDPAGEFTYIPAKVKEKVSLPVVGVGGLHTPELIKKALAENKMDIVAMCRGLIADPHLVKKIKENREAEQQLCIRCNLCLKRTWEGVGLMCSVNSMMGKEASRDLAPVPESKRKKIVIVGGGVAGMEAAGVAAGKGHDVTLYEMRGRLGGQVLAASVIKNMDTFKSLVNSYEARLRSLNVNVTLNHKITGEEINKLQPQVVIIATGAKEKIADIPGVNQTNVTTGGAVLFGEFQVAGKVAVIGATMIGCQVALHLANNGCEVELISKSNESDFGSGLMMDNVQMALMDRMAEKAVRLRPETELLEIKETEIILKNNEGSKEVLEIDYVVFTEEFVPTKNVPLDIINGNIEVFQVGDCTKPKNVFSAIQQGANAAFECAKS